jgi:hypothetical protein
MRRTASEVLRSLEMRVARLENRTASTTKMKNPLIVRVDEDEATILIYCPKSELKNIEGYGEMSEGAPMTQRGQAGEGSNPMVATKIIFQSEGDLRDCIANLSRVYSLIEPH